MNITPTPARPAPAAAAEAVIDTTTQAFGRDVIDESRKRPVLVDFWAPWCGPCRTLSPIIERVVKGTKGAVRLVKMNIDDHPSIYGQLGLQSIPAVIAFVNGRAVDGFLGAIPEGQVKAFIDRIAAPTKAAEVDYIAEGDKLLAAGEPQGAAEFYAAAHEADAEDVRAIAGLARAAVALGELDQAKQMLALAPPAKAGDAALKAAAAELQLAEQTAQLGDPRALSARLAADPKDHQARFDLALIENARGNRDAAVGLLLDIMRADRAWGEDKARKQLVSFFDVWGPRDEATLSGRRRLSSLLFS